LPKTNNLKFIFFKLFYLGISWIVLPLAFIDEIKRNDFYNGMMFFFTILNTLQGVFIFIHFVVTVQVLLKNTSSKTESSPLTSGTRVQ